MANLQTVKESATRTGWAYRFFGSLTSPSRTAPPTRGQTLPEPEPGASKVRGMARQLVADDRYTFVLLKEAADDIAEADARPAWAALARQMALIPAGRVPVVLTDGTTESVEVPALYLDRYAVTNLQFQKFVDSGGYDNLEMWPQEVWPSLMKFSDLSRRPGPRDWQRGRFPSGRADHPVVGVCWYEAAAYASWQGKRLPASDEWQKAGGWPEHLSGGVCNRYPWGNVFDPARANLWASGVGRTVAVGDRPEGATPNGIYHMSGNVWEWLADPLDTIPCAAGESFVAWRPMRRIVGGAFDTYFPAEATSQFVTGQAELERRENIGFRCALTASRLRDRGTG